jgi:uncharacterized protein (DUF983 family)
MGAVRSAESDHRSDHPVKDRNLEIPIWEPLDCLCPRAYNKTLFARWLRAV